MFTAVMLPGGRPPERVLKPGNYFNNSSRGSYRPQLGFSSRGSNFTPHGPPGPSHRMIRCVVFEVLNRFWGFEASFETVFSGFRHSLSDPRDHRAPQNHSSYDQQFTPSRYHSDRRGLCDPHSLSLSLLSFILLLLLHFLSSSPSCSATYITLHMRMRKRFLRTRKACDKTLLHSSSS